MNFSNFLGFAERAVDHSFTASTYWSIKMSETTSEFIEFNIREFRDMASLLF